MHDRSQGPAVNWLVPKSSWGIVLVRAPQKQGVTVPLIDYPLDIESLY